MQSNDHLEALFQEGLKALGLRLDSAPFMAYLALMEKWNRVYNLTAIKDPETMMVKHLLDSLAIASFIKGEHVLDIGSGAGLPGIPLALCFPEKSFVLVDSIGKKIQFLATVIRTLRLENVFAIQTRIETYQPPQLFDTITFRALGTITQCLHWSKHLLSPQGRWVAMKGQPPTEELQALDRPFFMQSYVVPGLDASRCVVCIEG